MKLYAISISATRYKNGDIAYFALAAGALAKTNEEAVGKGYLMAKEQWPQSEGYTNQSAVICEIPVDMFEQMLEYLREERKEVQSQN